ncbi:MAG: FtsX-like permease family protein [Parasporobacterium sp.]|nr:FtsX-like permease family protein [Parasporobacterium sp.]
MRHTFFKEILRTIKKQKVSFISILVVALLAVTAYLGINFSAAAMKNNAADFYKSHNFRDFEITSTQLLTEEDLDALRETEGVADVEGLYQTTGKIDLREMQSAVSILSLTERINVPSLDEGRLPTAADECAVEGELAEENHLKVGSKVRLLGTNNGIPEYLKTGELTITGIFTHPDHYAKKKYVPENRYLLVTKEAFDQEALEGGMLKALVLMEKPEDMKVFDSVYGSLSEEMNRKLEEMGTVRAGMRTEAVHQKAEDKINEGQKKLDDGKEKLENARKELDKNEEKLRDGQQQLADGKKQLDEGKDKLDAAAAELANGELKLQEAKAQLDAAGEQIRWAENELASKKVLLDEGKAQLDSAKAQLDAGKQKLEEAETLLRESFLKAEEMKTAARSLIRTAVRDIFGDKAADQFSWAEPMTEPDLTDPQLSISLFAITTDYVLNLGGDLSDLLRSAILPLLERIGHADRFEEILAYIESSGIYQSLNESYAEIVSEKMRQWDDGHTEYISGRALYLENAAKYEEGYAQYESGLAQYEAGLAEFLKRKEQYEAGLAEYQNGLALFENMKAQYETGFAEYQRRLAEYEDALSKLENGKKELEKAEKEYDKGEKEYEEGAGKLEQAKKDVAALSPCYWVVLDVDGNGGFQHARNSADNIKKLGMTFAMLFVLVGALIIYVTVQRIIEEQRTLVGTQKALGFYGREILLKYLLFGGSATLLGMLVGAFLGYIGIQWLVLIVHQQFYIPDMTKKAFLILLFLIVLAAGLLLTGLSVWLASRGLIRQSARELMQGKMPVVKKKGAAKTNPEKALYSRLILRNILTDKARVIVTIVSIAGSCVLMMIGLTLQYGVSRAITIQEKEFVDYEARQSVDTSVSETSEAEYRAILEKNGAAYTEAYVNNVVGKTNGKYCAFELISGDEELLNFIHLRDIKTRETISLPASGVVIPQQIAKGYGLSVGDTITIYDEKMNPCEATIAGICEFYIGRNIYLSPEGYQELFGKEPVLNTFFFRSGGNMDVEQIEEELEKVKGIGEIFFTSETFKTYRILTSALTSVTLILIVAAGLMAAFILLNLINMYLSQKKRELTIMRINGFTSKEVIRYVSLESIVTTGLGILLGLLAGGVLGDAILGFLEQPQGCFNHSISLIAILLSTAITILFSVVINAIGLRKVKNLKLTDID